MQAPKYCSSLSDNSQLLSDSEADSVSSVDALGEPTHVLEGGGTEQLAGIFHLRLRITFNLELKNWVVLKFSVNIFKLRLTTSN